MRKVIVNTTPLIALCHVEHLDILKKIYGEISIPQAVYRELSEKKELYAESRWMLLLIGFMWKKLKIIWQNLCSKHNYMMVKQKL